MKRYLFSLALCLFSSALLQAQDVTAKFLPSGVTQKVGGYKPIRAEMNQEASIVDKFPDDFFAAKFGWLELGDSKF